MQIDVYARGFPISRAIQAYVDRRLRFALPLEHARVRRVVVRLEDVNGPRGGSDKTCCIRIALNGCADLVMEETQPDLYVAIDRASERMGARLYRLFDRVRDHRKESRGARFRPQGTLSLPDYALP